MELLSAWDIVEAAKNKGHYVGLVEVGGPYNPEAIWRCTIDGKISAEARTSLGAVLKALELL